MSQCPSVPLLEHHCSCLLIPSFMSAVLHELSNLLYQMVFQEAIHPFTGGLIAVEREAAHHVLVGELLWQTAKALIGLLTALDVY